jgi:hypothetical protein
MNYRSLALAIAALSSSHITTADAQSVYVAPGGVYIGGGPVYVVPAPSSRSPILYTSNAWTELMSALLRRSHSSSRSRRCTRSTKVNVWR